MEIYTVTIEPVNLPVTLDEVKAYMRVTASYEDTLITGLLNGAIKDLENFTGQWFITRTADADYDYLETGGEKYPFSEIRRGPLVSVDAVEITKDSAQVAVTEYQVKDNPRAYARVLFTDTLSGFDDVPRPLKITFKAGYGTAAASVPEPIKTAIKKYVAYMYNNRGSCASGDTGIDTIKQELANAGYQIQLFWGGCL